MTFRTAMAALACLLTTTTCPIAECRLEAGPQRTVTRAIDGETLMLDDGSEVRLAGALSPRGIDAGVTNEQWAPAMAAQAALAALTEGRNVVLGYLGAVKRDRQNRHVAQVFVVENGNEIWVQGRMLSEGHARVYQQKDQRGCIDDMLAYEHVARASGTGLWAIDAYRVRPALRNRDLEGMAGKYAVLTGRVAWVAEGRQNVAIGFIPSQMRAWTFRRGVVVMIDNNDRTLLGSVGGNAKSLEGKNIEVRGWLEQRPGRPAASFIVDVSLSGLIIVPPEPAKPAAEPRSAAPAAEDAKRTEIPQ